MGNIINDEYFKCSNQDKNIVSCYIQIGFTYYSYHKAIFIVLSVLGILFGIITFIDYAKETIEKFYNKRGGSIRKIFRLLPVLDFSFSLYWLISSTAFISVNDIYKKKTLSVILSFLYTFLLIFTLCIINCMLTHFRKMNYDPIASIIKSNKNFFQYLIRSLILSVFTSFLALFLGVLGKSPMNTCFINTELNRKSAFVYIIIIILIILAFYKIIHSLYFSKMFINKDKERDLFMKNSMYALIFCFSHIPLCVLFLITFFRQKNIVENDSFLPEFSYLSTILLFYSPLINFSISIYQGMLRLKFFEKCMKKDNTYKTINLNNTDITATLTTFDQYDSLDKLAIQFFMRNILIGIGISLKKSKKTKIISKFNKNDYVDSIKHEINFSNFDLNDEETRNSEYLDVKIIEYAPKCFAYLRNLENINIDDMITSFLPKNNKSGIKKSAGKSGSFFISTDDQQYMIKTLKSDEFELIRKSFLEKYIEYITENPNSLLSRIYGIFNIIQYNGNDFYIIVMRNVIGNLKENIVAKFDLKGSTTNRELKGIDMTKIDNDVMKDLNFNDIEFAIMLNNKNIKLMRDITTKDSLFLAGLGLMDYSLFVVKLSLNKEESIEIFGEDIQEKQEKDYMQVITDKTVVGNNINDTTNLDISNLGRNSIRSNITSKYAHYKTYLFPGLNIGTAYIISIIDFLQTYNFYKLVEYGYKTAISGQNADAKGGISCVNPKLYSERFINYVNNMTQTKHTIIGKNKE